MTTRGAEADAQQLMDELQTLGVELWESEGQLRFRAPRGAIDASLRSRLQTFKSELRACLRAGPRGIEPRPDEAFEPFPLTEIQSAYLLGRSGALPFGGLPCQAYLELEVQQLAVDALEPALNRAIDLHPALRTRIFAEGYQEVQRPSLRTRVAIHDFSGSDLRRHCAAVRHSMLEASRARAVDDWPLFELAVTRRPQGCVLHLVIDLMVADFVSVDRVLKQVIGEANGEPQAAAPAVSFRDVVIAQLKQRESGAYDKAREHWLSRLDDLPTAPELPLMDSADPFAPVDVRAFARRSHVFSGAQRDGMLARARAHGVTPSVALLAAYAEVLRRWSRRPDFTLNVTMMQRPPLHPDIQDVVGDFTSTSLLECQGDSSASFAQRAEALQRRMWEDLEYKEFSGVEVLRELARKKGRDAALMPVVFTSTIGASPDDGANEGTRLLDGITWTPQVWLDCQVLESCGCVYVNWDYRRGVLSAETVDSMFDSYVSLMGSLATDAAVWSQTSVVPVPALRPRDVQQRSPWANRLLHAGYLDAVQRWPERTAARDCRGAVSYRRLHHAVCALAQRLDDLEAGPFVAIAMDKGVEQVIAALGIVASGRAYVPVDVEQPRARIELILEDAAVDCVLVQPWRAESAAYGRTRTLSVDASVDERARYVGPSIDPRSPAYLIYTSGTTGKPKGVLMSHAAAANTIGDINARLSLTSEDAVLGLAQLSFDLSVYDIFGTLSVGAALVLPDPELRSSPGHWHALVEGESISIWNSVPAQAVMLHEFVKSLPKPNLGGLRKMLLSGDWVPVALAQSLSELHPGLDVISLGGATEAAIWSIWHPIREEDSRRPSIPYGLPLTGQDVHVFNAAYEECPIGVVGEIVISGLGLADGYFNDPERTRERFVVHPRSGLRLYRTGDLGRYMPNGEIEFLGREDDQVKIRGHRVELGEIASVLESHPEVASSAVVFSRAEPTAPGQDLLVAFAVPDRVDGEERSRRLQTQRDVEARLAAVSEAACREIDAGALLELTEWLESTAHHTLLALIRRSVGDGPWTLSALYAALGCAPQYRRIIRRGVAVLSSARAIEAIAEGYRVADPPRVSALDEPDWTRAFALAARANYPAALLAYFRSSSEQLAQLISGVLAPTELFFPGGSDAVALAAFRSNPSARLCNALAAEAVSLLCDVGAARGLQSEILEVGAGAGGLTVPLLEHLGARDFTYAITDISQFYLTAAAARHSGDPRITCSRLDLLEGDPDAGPFDIVVCGDVLHALPDIPRALRTLASLLRPGGWLVLLEATEEHAVALTSLELMLPLGAHGGEFLDGRARDGRAFLSAEEWRQLLASSGWVVSGPEPAGELGRLGLQVFLAQNRVTESGVRDEALRQHLEGRLPRHMLPQQIRLVDHLPLSPNGKVDRKQLLSRIRRTGIEASRRAAAAPPTGEVERSVAEHWGQVLKREVLDRNEGFFELGGDSLIAARLAGRIIEHLPSLAGQRHFDAVLRLLMEGASLADFVERLRESGEDREALTAVEAPEESLGLPRGPALLALRRGVAGKQRLSILVDTRPAAAGEVRFMQACAAELVIYGAVANAGVASGVVESDGSVLLQAWLESVFAQLSPIDARAVCVFAGGDDAFLGIELARHIALSGASATVECCLIDPCWPGESTGPAGSLRWSAAGTEPFSFDLTVLRSAVPSQQEGGGDLFWRAAQMQCVGRAQERVLARGESSLEVLLDWLESRATVVGA